MADTKRRRRDDGKRGREKSKMNGKKQKSSDSRAQLKSGGRRKKSGPRLPSSLQKEIERLNPTAALNSDEDIASDDYNEEGEIYGKDVYELDEERAEEESQKNKRYDQVGLDKFEYELPDELSDDFKDEDLESDDENVDDDDYWGTKDEKAVSDDSEGEDDGRHTRMLQGLTGMPSEAFEEKRKKKKNDVIPESYPESEYNPSLDVIDGDGCISIDGFLDSLRGKSGYSKLRKREQQIEKNARIIHAPLPKADQAKVERKVAYELSKKDITKWEPIIKRNREASTILFDEDTELGFSTVGAIASEFKPRTEFERKIAALVGDNELREAHNKDGSRLLELNEISIEDEKERQNRIAKMRSLLFRHEMKAKHIKKIKSKTYHRLLKKDKIKAISAQIEVDPEAAKEFALKQERLRAEERMTLKHKNQNRWAQRILSRGLNNQDEGTRAAVAEQLRRHTELTRKMNSMKDSSSSSSSDDSSDDDADENLAVSDGDRASKLLEKAKEKTMEVLEEEDEVPKSGLLSLPFMRRGLAKRKKAAAEEAKLALQEYDHSLMNMENPSIAEDTKVTSVCGRRVFGTAKSRTPDASDKIKSDNFYGNSDSEDGLEARENGDMVDDGSNNLQNVVMSDPVLIQDDTDTHEESVFKNFNEIIKDPGPKTTYEVAIFASDTWKKAKNRSDKGADIKKSLKLTGPAGQELKDTEKESEEVSDTDSEGHMVDGILSSGLKHSYKLPSQEELIRQAFACDDVEDDFEKDKQDILNEENPEPEKPLLLPGWGQWTDIQQKKGLPSWMLKEHDIAKKKREEALKKRKDANLKHVIISEKVDKKAEKLHTKALPYPFTSQEVFDQSLRMPIGPEFNPATTAGALNRPEVVKRPGVIIKPIEFEDLLEKTGRGIQKPKLRNKGNGGKTMKKTKTNHQVRV